MRKVFAALSVACLLALPVTIASAGEQEGEVCYETVHVDEVPAVTHEETLPIQRYSYVGGPQGLDENGVPFQTTAPGSDWQANTTTYNDGTSDGGHLGLYFVSHGGSGNGDWFYWEVGTVVIIDTPAIPAHDEQVEVECESPTPTPTESPDPPTGPTGPTGPTPSDPPPHEQWSPSWTPSWTPPGKLQVGEAPKGTAHTGADVTGALVAMELIGSLGFGSLAAARKK